MSTVVDVPHLGHVAKWRHLGFPRMDRELLDELAKRRGLTKAEELASHLGEPIEVVRRRLLALVQDGYATGPVLARWETGGEGWEEMGYGIGPRGPEALGER